MKKKILVTGCAGYLGSNLINFLNSKKNLIVSGIDIGFFDECIFLKEKFKYYKIDLREVDDKFYKEFDCIIHLSGVSNNPLKIGSEEISYLESEKYTFKIADICKKNNIKLIFPSSCSVYGNSEDEFVDEDSIVNPLTSYSKNKIRIEDYLNSIKTENFFPIILRLSTVFGLSSRMRFDIVLNMFVGMAITSKEITLNSDGEVYRPLVDIDDVCNVIYGFIFFDKNVDNNVFNVGNNNNNIKIIDLAKKVCEYIKGTKIKSIHDENQNNVKLNLVKDSIIDQKKDFRNYRVRFDKMNKLLKGYKCETTIEKGILKMSNTFKNYNLNLSTFQNIKFYRQQYLNFLIEKKYIDNRLKLIKNLNS